MRCACVSLNNAFPCGGARAGFGYYRGGVELESNEDLGPVTRPVQLLRSPRGAGERDCAIKDAAQSGADVDSNLPHSRVAAGRSAVLRRLYTPTLSERENNKTPIERDKPPFRIRAITTGDRVRTSRSKF